MVVTIDLGTSLDIVMEIVIEEAAIDVVHMVIIATTMKEENKYLTKWNIKNTYL